MLHLGMVPPTVEKTYNKKKGAAVFWIEGTKNFNAFPDGTAGGAPTPPASKSEYWSIPLTRAKMFDSLIGNQDPNLGNWLVDDDWNLSIIDHSLITNPGDMTFVHEKQLNHIDSELLGQDESPDDGGSDGQALPMSNEQGRHQNRSLTAATSSRS